MPSKELLPAEAAVDVLCTIASIFTVGQEGVGDEVLVVVHEVSDEDLDAEEVAVAARTRMVLSVNPGYWIKCVVMFRGGVFSTLTNGLL